MKRKVLIVDDDRGILDSLQFLLQNEGYDVQTASGGEETFFLMNSFKPEVVVLDILLAGEDGRDICKRIKRKRQLMKTPVVMMSAHVMSDETLKETGASAFLRKPFDIDTFLDTIGDVSPNGKGI